MNEHTTNLTPETTAPIPNIEARVYPVTPKKNLVGFASVTIGGAFAANDIPVKMGANGIFFDNPSRPDGKGGFKPVFLPITKEARQQMTEAISVAYDKAINKIKEMGKAHESKPSIKEQLQQGAKQAAAKPPTAPNHAPQRNNMAL